MELPFRSIFFGSRPPPFATNKSSLPSSRRSTLQNPFPVQAKQIPLLVLSLEPNLERFHLSRAAKTYLESLQGECCVISVSGDPMIGKSTFLDLLISLFNWDASQGEIIFQDIYKIGDNIESTTQEIDMYCLPKSEKNSKNIIFLDIEGDNDPERGQTGTWINNHLIHTAAGISHVHLYNYTKTPHNNFFKYFQDITMIGRQNDVHQDFETKFIFIRRDFPDEKLLAQGLETSANKIERVLNPSNINYSLHFLPEPPLDITQKNSPTSCIASNGALCQACQSHLFTSRLLTVRDDLKNRIDQVPSFQSGRHLCEALENLLEVNRQEIPFFLDRGCVSEIRRSRIQKEQVRISAGLSKVARYHAQNSLYEEVLRIINDHPRLANSQGSENLSEIASLLGSDQLSLNDIASLAQSEIAVNLASNQVIKDFNETGKDLEVKVAQLEYMVGELSKFIDQYLLDERASILNDTENAEKNALWAAYVEPFDRILKEVVALFRKYSGMIEFVCKNLVEIQTHTVQNLKEYVAAASETRNRTMTIAIELVSSGLLGFIGREIAGKAVAALFVGGGVVGGVITAFFFFQAWQKLREAIKKNDESLNRRKIEGIRDVKDAKEELKRMEEFVTGLVEELKNSRETLKGICLEDDNEGFDLVARIGKAMDDKMNGGNLSPENRAQLEGKVKAAKDNVERFKLCL